MRQYWTISYYLLREMLISFVVGFLFFFFIFFVNNLLLLIQNENILAKNIPLTEIFLIVLFRLPIVILFAFPFGTLIGALMAVARLSADNEILSLRACGVPTLVLFLPFFFLGVILSLLSFYTNDYLLPAGSLEQKKLGQRMFLAHPQLNLEANSVLPVPDSNILIMTGDVDENYIYRIIIFDRTFQQDRRIITAQRAQVVQNIEQTDVITLRLENVFCQTIDEQQKDNFKYETAEVMEYNLLLKPFMVNLSLGPMEKPVVDIVKIINEKQNELNNQIKQKKIMLKAQLYDLSQEIRLMRERGIISLLSIPNARIEYENRYASYLVQKSQPIQSSELKRYLLEIHRKFAFPFGCLAFIFLAFPVGLLARRSGRIFGFGIGLLASIIYWGLLLVGHELGFNQDLLPFFSMWMPNFIVLAAGIILLGLRLRK